MTIVLNKFDSERKAGTMTFLEIGKWRITGWKATVLFIIILYLAFGAVMLTTFVYLG